MPEKEMEKTTSLNGEVWGTLEELLLACAVNRHGTTSWDSIAKELQKRINHSFVFSPHNCKQKYVDLKRRFSSAVAEERESNDDELSRMVDELRKLRVDQLKREVQRHDLSIVSLQLKVRRLEEERENTLQKPEGPEGGSDLRVEPEGNAARTGVKADEPEQYSAEKFDSAENRSFNESNEPSHNNKNSSPEKERESESKSKQRVGPDPVEPVKESGSIASRRAELGESVSESKRDSGKQSSDVQSSASLSKLKKKRRRFRGGGSSGDELEAEEVSPANKRISVKSQPLIRFLEILRSHKHGSAFQRRLSSQEMDKYRNVIRQRMDLDMVQSRLDKGLYDDCHPKFYRDLLLIFTNAVLFYCKSSAEHLAAQELRKLVTDEITQMTRKSDKIRSDTEITHLEPVLKKPRSSTTNMVVCRRRSSSCMQALSESMKNQNGSKVENEELEPKVDDRGNSNRRKKKREEECENEKPGVADQRSSLRSGGLRLSNNNNRKIISKEVANKREKVLVSNEKPGINTSKGASVSKKQGAANFLKRMKQNSPSTTHQEKGKNYDSEEEEENRESREKEESNGKAKGGNLKRNTGKVDVVVSRRNPTRRGEREVETSTARRAGGRRPPKRKVAVISSTPEPRKGGRRSSGRDGDDQKSKKKPRR